MRFATPILFRYYVPADAGFVRALAIDAFSEYDGDGAATRTLAMVTAESMHTLVAESSSRPLGFVALGVHGDAAHISAIAVVRDARGRGVGARLLRVAEKLALRLGAWSVELETGEANLAALDLFVRAGYRVEGRIPRYYRSGYDALTLRRDLF